MRVSKTVLKEYFWIYLKQKTPLWSLFKLWNEQGCEFLDRILKTPHEEHKKCDNLPVTA